MSAVQLSVIIPVFNKFSLTRDCLHSLREHAPAIRMEVIVVDNGSSDETSTELEPLGRTLFGDDFMAIHLPENVNFGPASNLGAQKSSGDLLFFLNNDTILSEGWFEPLAVGLTGDCGMVGPLLMYPETGLFCDRVQHLGVACKPQLHPCHLYEFFPTTHPVTRKTRMFQFLTGAAMLMPRLVFEKAGMFHEAYINGGEDLDLCVQVRRSGHTLRCVPESRIYHLQSQTPGRHDHEKHNADILRQRCVSDLYPDLHLHVHADGYELALNKSLVPFVRLPERRKSLMRRAFFRDTDMPNAEACLDMMEREPLFGPAYERLTSIYRELGDSGNCANVRFLQSRLFPGQRSGELLSEAAQWAGHSDLQRDAKRILEFYHQLAYETDLSSMAQEMVRYGQHLQQPVLSSLYSDWLETIQTETVES